MTPARTAAAALFAFAMSALPAHEAHAAKPVLALTASPLFGVDGATAVGWTGVVARLESGGPAVKGVLELTATSSSWRGEEQSTTVRAPFHVPAGRAVLVRMPVLLEGTAIPTVHLRATREGGGLTLADTTLSLSTNVQPVLVDVASPSRLVPALRGARISADWAPFASSGSRAPTTFAVGAPSFDPATSDPVLPERAAEWAGATVVVLRSALYARLAPAPREALERWVLAGGTLAVVPTRPEDLRQGPLVALVGGEAREAAPSPMLLGAPTPEPTDPSESDTLAPEPTQGAVPMTWRPTSTSPTRHASHMGPPPGVRAKIIGYQGGRLAQSAFGATARAGLGEVHVLPFDPSERPMVDDPWVHGRLAAMVERAWDRRAASAFPLGFRGQSGGENTEVRRALDPNENFRPALAIASLLLLVYAVLVGPVLFLVSTRRGKPLAPLKWAPLMSAVTFGLIVLIGFAGRGFRGRARQIALVEAPAGEGRAAVRRFRGFFASRTETLVIPASDATGMLDVVTADAERAGRSVLRVERDGMTLEGLTSLAWQTVVVREDALAEIGQGVAVHATSDGDATVTNHTGHALRDLVVWVPRSGLYYAPLLADGATITAKTGRFLRGPGMRDGTNAGSLKVHRLSTSYLAGDIGGRDGARVADAWRAIESAAGDGVDWFPDDEPVVLGMLEGAPSPAHDAGLAVESSRALVRIVGEGGST